MSATALAEHDAQESDLQDDSATFDIVDGFRVERHMSNEANLIACQLAHLVGNLLQHPRGIVSTEIVVRLVPGEAPLRPDVVFISREKIRGLQRRNKDPWEVVPELVVEVVSPTNRVGEIEEKLERYFAAGVVVVLVVSSRARRVAVYSSTKSVRIHEGSEVFDLAPALPDMTIALDELYAPLEQ